MNRLLSDILVNETEWFRETSSGRTLVRFWHIIFLVVILSWAVSFADGFSARILGKRFRRAGLLNPLVSGLIPPHIRSNSFQLELGTVTRHAPSEEMPLEPVILNTLQRILAVGADMEPVLKDIYKSRVILAPEDDAVSAEDWVVVEYRCRAVVQCLPRLKAALLAATEDFSYRHGDFGLPLEERSDPLVWSNRIRCLVALWMLHLADGGPLAVTFVDPDVLAVLSNEIARDTCNDLSIGTSEASCNPRLASC